jgi:hypothetical protein
MATVEVASISSTVNFESKPSSRVSAANPRAENTGIETINTVMKVAEMERSRIVVHETSTPL